MVFPAPVEVRFLLAEKKLESNNLLSSAWKVVYLLKFFPVRGLPSKQETFCPLPPFFALSFFPQNAESLLLPLADPE